MGTESKLSDDLRPRQGRLSGFEAERSSVSTWTETRPSVAGTLMVWVRGHEDGVTLVLAGELDSCTCSLVREALDEIERDRPLRLVIDLSELSFIDSVGVHLIVSEYRRARHRGRPKVELRPGPWAVQRVFRIGRADAELPFRIGH
jgi:anti-sigma B factor antagonist